MVENLAEKDEYIDKEHAEVLKKLVKSQSTKERVRLFGKVMDTY